MVKNLHIPMYMDDPHDILQSDLFGVPHVAFMMKNMTWSTIQDNFWKVLWATSRSIALWPGNQEYNSEKEQIEGE